MLYSLEFANSNSFRDTQDFNLARPAKEAKQSKARWPKSNWNHEISPVAAIFGANASGKSGLIRSLWMAIKNPTFGDEVLVRPFRLEQDLESRPVTFDIRFEAPNFTMDSETCEYHYRFEASSKGYIRDEELRFYPNSSGKSRRVFKRTLLVPPIDANKKAADYEYRWGEAFKGEKAFAVRVTAPDALFLGNTPTLDQNPLEPVINWLDSMVHFYSATGYEVEFARVKKKLHDDPELLAKVINYVSQADLGIVDLKVISRSEEDVAAYRRSIENQDIPKVAIERAIEEFALELTFTHEADGERFDFHEHLESDGTRAMLSFSSIAIEALESGSLIIIDEIDTSLHPLLVRELIRQFTSPETNPNQAQLVFTTHDVTLLHNPVWLDPMLDRDQIWLVEKGKDGASTLCSISDFPVRNDENIFRKYLAGQYGSVPQPNLSLHIHTVEA